MNALGFAGRSLVRQPARAALGILGVAAVGALLFDMLLLSQGLIVSMRDLLDRSGFDVRIGMADRPGGGSPIPDAERVAARIAALPSVRSVLTVRTADAALAHRGRELEMSIQGVAGAGPRPWTVMRGQELTLPAAEGAGGGTQHDSGPRSAAEATGEDQPQPRHQLLLNEYAARTLDAEPGAAITVHASCRGGNESLPPLTFEVAGIANFLFDSTDSGQAATSAASLAEACGDTSPATANLILVTSRGDADAAAEAISALDPGLQALTNDDAVGRIEETGFTYFRQISAVLTAVTLAFALLLITVLLTVSVNQRLGVIAALRALGFSRRRVASDILSESALIVGVGGMLSVPLGAALAGWLDTILKRMPGIPADLHFFVFEWRALGIHLALLIVTAMVAALYPMRIAARLPIAATLRNEVVS